MLIPQTLPLYCMVQRLGRKLLLNNIGRNKKSSHMLILVFFIDTFNTYNNMLIPFTF